jgi:Tfp pilus assembly protein PilO
MQAIIVKLHWFIFLYAIFISYEMYSAHQEVHANLTGRLPVLENKIKNSKKKARDLKKYFKDIEDAKKNIERVALAVEKVQKRLPTDIADSENLDLISQIANSINIKSVFIKPEAEIDQGFYYIKNYVLTAEGTYLQFLVLFEKIAESKRLLNIKTVIFDQIIDRVQRARFKLIKAKVTVQAYRYNASFKESRGIEAIESEFKNKKPKTRKKRKKPKKMKK